MPRSSVLHATLTATMLLTARPALADTLAYVGTYTGAKSEGIYAFRVTTDEKGAPVFAPLGLAAKTESPSFLAIDPARHLVFAVNELDHFSGRATGAVSAFSADPVTGRLTLINQLPSEGTHPCHLALDPTGRWLVVANYSSGSVALFPVAADGRLGKPSVVQHEGHSVDANRQRGPHAHCATFDPTGRFLFICDLGIDRVVAYQLDATAGKLVAVPGGGATLAPGAGPRHLAFAPDGRHAYVLNELTATVTGFAYEPTTGALRSLATVAALPSGFSGAKSGAEIAFDPSGRWLYTSNRGHDSLARFAVNPTDGHLTFAGTVPSGVKTPRHFALLPDGRHLVAAGQDSDSLQVFAINDGSLAPVGQSIPVGKPVCTAFLVTPAAK
jgi:6-phosphogluconolactonase